MEPRAVQAMFKKLAAADPHPTTELTYANPFELLVAVILSAQATDMSVNKATRTLFASANTPAALLALGEHGLKQHIKAIGLFNAKARHLMITARQLIELHRGEVPQTREALEALPGVGRKTANVVLNTAFGEPTIAVDTHIFRVANRTGLAPGKTPLQVEEGLLVAVPKKYRQHAHHWLILHGRYTCMARRPKCATCIIGKECTWSQKKEYLKQSTDARQ
ncbi:MAG: endonuclease III [Gammaproteobacteria bacterium]|nr:endonuclease III [Gammaproteobacteria bacterium]